MSYLINTSFYEGPMDLIFDLITKKKLDIYEVSISEITQQYLQSIENISQMDMEIASEFVLMASRLLEIKSKYMLYISNENEEEDPRKELFENIKEYSKFKNASNFLKEKYSSSHLTYKKPKAEIYYEEFVDISEITLDKLIKVIPHKKETVENDRDISFTKKIISIEEKINEIKEILVVKNRVYFDELVEHNMKDDHVATMLSLLELAKTRDVSLMQINHLDRIHIERLMEVGQFY